MHGVTFSNVQVAEKFCRFVAGKGDLRGAMFWNAERWIATAESWARRLTAKDAAQVLQIVKAKGVKFSGCSCMKCGALLTAPESVLSGIGPECAKGMAA